jgi:hypothetical protein
MLPGAVLILWRNAAKSAAGTIVHLKQRFKLTYRK